MAQDDIPSEMKAVRVVEYNKPYSVDTVKIPRDLGPRDLLIKVAVASNCHTDSMVQAGTFKTELPSIASHEGSGTVVALGSEVKDFKVGSRVMCGIPVHPCGKCDDCKQADEYGQYCTQVGGLVGVTVDGCFAEYVKVDSRTSTPMPDEVSFLSAAPLACAGRTVWKAVLQTGLKKGETVAMVGSGGGLGHLGIQFAKALGLRVIGIDARDEGLELSKYYGADLVVDVRDGKDKVVKTVQDATGGRGADSTINLSDHETAAALACAVTKMHGIMVQIAQPDEVSVPFRELVFRDVKIHGSLMCSEKESREMLATIAKNGVTVTTNRFDGLDKIKELVELVHGGKIKGKAVIIVDPEQIEHEKKIGAKY